MVLDDLIKSPPLLLPLRLVYPLFIKLGSSVTPKIWVCEVDLNPWRIACMTQVPGTRGLNRQIQCLLRIRLLGRILDRNSLMVDQIEVLRQYIDQNTLGPSFHLSFLSFSLIPPSLHPFPRPILCCKADGINHDLGSDQSSLQSLTYCFLEILTFIAVYSPGS